MATSPAAASPSARPPAPPSGFKASLERLSSNPKARIGALVAAGGLVIVLALRSKKKSATGTTVTGDANTGKTAQTDASGGTNDPTIGEILNALGSQTSATTALVDAASALTAAAAKTVAPTDLSFYTATGQTPAGPTVDTFAATVPNQSDATSFTAKRLNVPEPTGVAGRVIEVPSIIGGALARR